MKFYKIVNPEGHNGLVYKEGMNVDPKPFKPYGNCEPGGIYFSREDIFAFLEYGTELYEVEPVGEVYENPDSPKKWKAHSVNLKYIGKVVDNIKFLIEQGADIHSRDDYALRWSAQFGHLDVIKYLVQQGANIHAQDDFALRWSAEKGHIDVVKYLVENGANIHADDDCALCWSAENGHLEVVKYLVEQGADIHADDDCALQWSAENGQTEVVEYLKSLNKQLKEIEMKFYKIVNPEGHNGLVYKEGLNVDTEPFNTSGDCEGGGIYFSREDILAFLDFGSELYEVEPIGEIYENPGSPKKFKAHSVNLKYVGKVKDNIKFLVEQGADIHVENNFPLKCCVGNGNLDIVKCLVEVGADIRAENDFALRWSAVNGHFNVVKYLVENGADIHIDNEYALCQSAKYGHLEVVKYLIKQGADIHAQDNYALQWSVKNGHKEVANYLKSLSN